MAVKNLTAQELRELFVYDAETGLFDRRTQRGPARPGDQVGHVTRLGYLSICIAYKHHMAHRLAHLYMTGEWPLADIDHLNGNRLDNRWANLRSVTRSVNLQNFRDRPNSRSGLLGAFYSGGGGRKKVWVAQIKVGAKRICLGRFLTAEEAHAAYIAAKRELHVGCTI